MSDLIETWAIVELMGHVRTAGKLSEVELFGAKMGRLEVPVGDGFCTQFFGGASVYRITFVDEPAARAVAEASVFRPINSWEVYKALPSREPGDDEDLDQDEWIQDREQPQ